MSNESAPDDGRSNTTPNAAADSESTPDAGRSEVEAAASTSAGADCETCLDKETWLDEPAFDENSLDEDTPDEDASATASSAKELGHSVSAFASLTAGTSAIACSEAGRIIFTMMI